MLLYNIPHFHPYTCTRVHTIFFLLGMNFIINFNWYRKIREILTIILIMIKWMRKVSQFIYRSKIYAMPLCSATNLLKITSHFQFLYHGFAYISNFCPVISSFHSLSYNLWTSFHISIWHLFILLGHFLNFLSQPK